MDNGKKVAYPTEGYNSEDGRGLTKREHFAAMAMQGLLANPKVSDIIGTDNWTNDQLAYNAVCFADTLLKELE